jgi:hypothetical protein
MARLLRLVGPLPTAVVALTLTTVAFASPGGHTSTVATPRPSAAAGLGSPFASGSGTCDPIVGYTTFVALVDAYHSDPIVELTTDGPATLQAYPTDVDTGGAGRVWGAVGEPLSAGDHVSVQISCFASPADVNYSIALYDAPSTPFQLSGAATGCPGCSSTNRILFFPEATANYVAHLTLTQGSVDLSHGQSDQVFTSSGDFDLGNFGHGHQGIYLTPLAGPTANWALTIQALPVILSGLKFDVPYIEPTHVTTVSYNVDGDVTLSAVIKNSLGGVVTTLASDLAVPAGAQTLSWDGRNGSGTPVADGTYTVSITYTDAAGHSGSGSASLEVDGTPPVITPVSSTTRTPSGELVIGVHDALSGLGNAALSVDGVEVQSLTSGGSQFVYAPADGWSPGKHQWNVTATDNVGNTADSSGTFAVGTFTPPRCRVPRLIGKTPKRARRAIKRNLCSVGRVSHAHSRDRLKGRVVAQHPRAGRRLRAHSRVRFSVGLGRG